MQLSGSKKILVITSLCIAILVAQAFAQKDHDHDEKPTNLKVLPKDISGDDLHKIMKGYAKALGVKCGYCHYSEKVEGQDKPKWDFASDEKPEKKIARDMMRMEDAINSRYIPKIADGKLEQITCVTCHRGNTKPMVSVDSLASKP